MTKTICLLVLFLSSTALIKAEGYFTYSPKAIDVYQHIAGLRFETAAKALQEFRTEEPRNLIVCHLESYLDFLKAYLHESDADYERLKSLRGERLARIASGDPESPYFLFLQADIRLQTAIVRLKFEDYFMAFLDVQKAWKLLLENSRKFPGFLPNTKDLATLRAIIGTVPEQYQWGLKLLSGMEGSVSEGIAALDKIAHRDFVFAKEVTLIRALLALHLEQEAEKAWQIISKDPRFTPQSNTLDCFFFATFALRCGRNDEAIQLLDKRPDDPEATPFAFLDFLTGIAQLRRLDTNAEIHFKKFLHQFRGRHFIKEAWQKMAWIALLKGHTQKYHYYINKCLSEGHDISGEDQNALQEARSGLPPDPDLLKARLLFDGHYFQQALTLLEQKKPTDFSRKSDHLEYSYRLGRIWHGLEQYPRALQSYSMAILNGRNSPEYFACNAALQSGLIYEILGRKDEAAEAFDLCLSMYPDSYRAGLHQQAKAGLLRLDQ